jgi:hypothetical protein
MPTANDLFPTKYLSAEDLEVDISVTITGSEIATFAAQGERPAEEKLIVRFAEVQKGLALNKTNFNLIVKATGEKDSMNWNGKKITIGKESVTYKGDIVDAIRVKDAKASDPVVQKYWQAVTDMHMTVDEGRAHLKYFKGDFAGALAGLYGDDNTPNMDQLPPK